MPYRLMEGDCSYCDLCRQCDVAARARFGSDAVFPHREGRREFGKIQAGAKIYYDGPPRFKSLNDLQIVNNLFTEGRVRKREELGREPLYIDVNTETEIGGFRVRVPIVIGAMGSTDVSNRYGDLLGAGAAQAGIVYVIGENVLNMRGYDERIKPMQPTLRDRVMGFLQNAGDYGGVVIQQNVEDAIAGVWDRLFSDPSLEEYFERGLIGFEVKGGQGAKPGMGGEVEIDRELALRIVDKGYFFPVDPRKVEQRWYQRHSVPGTMTQESLEKTIRQAREKYNKKWNVPIWFKTGPYIDIDEQIEIAENAGADAITIDGTEGGTGMSPIGTMDHIGLPTLKCLQHFARSKGGISRIIAGGIRYGNHIVKSLALGADGVAMGRAFNVAAAVGAEELGGDVTLAIRNFVEADLVDVQQITSSLGKYDISELTQEDLMALDREVAEMFNIKYLWDF